MDKNVKTATTFEGVVNGRKFTTRGEMEAYIGKLVCEGTPIEEMRFGHSTQMQSTRTLEGKGEQLKPEQKPTMPVEGLFEAEIERDKPSYINIPFIKWMIPFINEEAILKDSQTRSIGIDQMVKDGEEKCKNRMDVFAKLIASRLAEPQYIRQEQRNYLLDMRDRFTAKMNWCLTRIDYFTKLLEVGNNKEGFVNIYACNEGIAVYDTARGFCAAMIDILSDYIMALER